MISGAWGASMIGEEARPNVPPSPFCLPFLEAPRGLGTASRRDPDARTSAARGGPGVHDVGVRVGVAPLQSVATPRGEACIATGQFRSERLARSDPHARSS